MNLSHVQATAKAIRLLTLDGVAAAHSGHLGLPLGCAEVASVLWGYFLKHQAGNPTWEGRDRFVLSGGHGSMLLYSLLHLSGMGLTLEDLKNFRKLHSRTPGHPEFGHTAGVEATTGPLGQGIANAVGMALAARMTQRTHKVWALAGDGCLQEGISYEAASLAGHWKLNNFFLIYDCNNITLDAPAAISQSETLARWEACGFEKFEVSGHDIPAIYSTLTAATQSTSDKPKIIVVRTTIAKGIAEVEGKNAGHGEAGLKFLAAAYATLGEPNHTPFTVAPEAYELFKAPHTTASLRPATGGLVGAQALLSSGPLSATDLAMRDAGGLALTLAANADASLVSGSADLFSSNKNYLKGLGDFSPATPTGRNIWFGIREHAMGAIANGLAYDGLKRPVVATFMAFSDYLRPAIRLAALSHLPVIYAFTHDSLWVGEDGPTHQPIEQLASLRLIPGLNVWRPADAEEALACVAGALQHTHGPSALILSRQALPNLAHLTLEARRQGTLHGGYIALTETGPLERILIASGSEIAPALEAAKQLPGTRVVSMPCLEVFKAQTESYRHHVLPQGVKTLLVEAARTNPWEGITQASLGANTFGLSAPGKQVAAAFGLTTEGILEKAKAL